MELHFWKEPKLRPFHLSILRFVYSCLGLFRYCTCIKKFSLKHFSKVFSRFDCSVFVGCVKNSTSWNAHTQVQNFFNKGCNYFFIFACASFCFNADIACWPRSAARASCLTPNISRMRFTLRPSCVVFSVMAISLIASIAFLLLVKYRNITVFYKCINRML